jgi:molecular chaperone HscA
MNMDKTTAAFLLSSLLERIERDGAAGSVSSHEKTALSLAIGLLGSGAATEAAPKSHVQTGSVSSGTADLTKNQPDLQVKAEIAQKLPKPTTPALIDVELNLASIGDRVQLNDGWLLCLDFGTAMSKAFASAGRNKHLDLELGAAAGQTGFTLPSSVFISDAGRVFFGFDAIEKSEGLLETGRERLDSIKEWLSLRIEGDLDGDSSVLQASMNPTRYRLTQGDLIRIYLAYLTDMAVSAMEKRGVDQARHVLPVLAGLIPSKQNGLIGRCARCLRMLKFWQTRSMGAGKRAYLSKSLCLLYLRSRSFRQSLCT